METRYLVKTDESLTEEQKRNRVSDIITRKRDFLKRVQAASELPLERWGTGLTYNDE